MSTPSAFQEKGCWKMRWPRSPEKNRPFSAYRRDCGEEAQLGHAEVLRLIDDDVRKRLL